MPEVDGSRLLQLFGLAGKTAVVTGAASGIGASVASLFRAAGARLVLAASTPDKLDATVTRLQSEGGREEDVLGVPSDVSEETQVTALFDQAVACCGRVDMLVNCAGVFPVVPFLESTVELWDRVHAINTRGAWLCTREAIRRMLADGKGGSIVAVPSLGAERSTIFGHAHYGSIKAGVKVASACLFLASPAASFITGECLVVDGGFSLS